MSRRCSEEAARRGPDCWCRRAECAGTARLTTRRAAVRAARRRRRQTACGGNVARLLEDHGRKSLAVTVPTTKISGAGNFFYIFFWPVLSFKQRRHAVLRRRRRLRSWRGVPLFNVVVRVAWFQAFARATCVCRLEAIFKLFLLKTCTRQNFKSLFFVGQLVCCDQMSKQFKKSSKKIKIKN